MADEPARTSPAISLRRVTALIGSSAKDLSFWEIMALFAFFLGTPCVVLYAMAGVGLKHDNGFLARFSTLYAVGLGARMIGGALGFLFGVPRYKAVGEDASVSSLSAPARMVVAFTPSTNLEQISDWLTKIIVGATLVQLKAISEGFAALCLWLGDRVQQPIAAVFSGGIMVFFFFAGFLWGYLWCSIRIFREMVRLTNGLQDKT